MPRAAKYRHVGSLLYRDETSSCGLAESGEWKPFAENVRAAIVDQSGSERVVPGMPIETEMVMTDIFIRARTGVTNRMRFRHVAVRPDGSTVTTDYDIQAVLMQDKYREIRLRCVRTDEQ